MFHGINTLWSYLLKNTHHNLFDVQMFWNVCDHNWNNQDEIKNCLPMCIYFTWGFISGSKPFFGYLWQYSTYKKGILNTCLITEERKQSCVHLSALSLDFHLPPAETFHQFSSHSWAEEESATWRHYYFNCFSYLECFVNSTI